MTLQILQRKSAIVVRLGKVRFRPDRLADQFVRPLRLPGLQGNQPEAIQRPEMVRLPLQNVRIDALRLCQPPLAASAPAGTWLAIAPQLHLVLAAAHHLDLALLLLKTCFRFDFRNDGAFGTGGVGLRERCNPVDQERLAAGTAAAIGPRRVRFAIRRTDGIHQLLTGWIVDCYKLPQLLKFW
jgi:hypothetical protein